MGLCPLSGLSVHPDPADPVPFATSDRFERLLGHSGLGFGVNVLPYLERREAAGVRAVSRVFGTAVERRRIWPVRSCSMSLGGPVTNHMFQKLLHRRVCVCLQTPVNGRLSVPVAFQKVTTRISMPLAV